MDCHACTLAHAIDLRQLLETGNLAEWVPEIRTHPFATLVDGLSYYDSFYLRTLRLVSITLTTLNSTAWALAGFGEQIE
jgi:hypothetical protein